MRPRKTCASPRPFSTEAPGRLSCGSLERARECGLRRVARRESDLSDGEIRTAEQLRGAAHTPVDEVLPRRHSEPRAEAFRECRA